MREIIFENKWVRDGDVMALHEIMIWWCSTYVAIHYSKAKVIW